MDINDIQNKILQLEKELAEYEKGQQEKLDDFMNKSGIKDFISETNAKIANFRGKIDVLKELLSQPEVVKFPVEEVKDKEETGS